MTHVSGPRSVLVLAAGVSLLSTACIERAQQPGDRRRDFDRSAIRDILVNSIPPEARHVGARFGKGGDQVELAAVLFEPPVAAPGSSVKVTFFFRVLDAEPDEDWKIFVHIQDPKGGYINGDHWPTGYGSIGVGSRYPMTLWRKGELIRDQWAFTATVTAPDVDRLDMWTGFWNPSRDERLPITNTSQVPNDGQNRVNVGSVGVRG